MKHITGLLILVATLTRLGAAPPVSTPVQSGLSAGGNSFNPTFSADGQHLVFVSHANNLVTNDDLGLWLDVFVRDLVNSNTVLVSVSTNGAGGANWDANYPSISSNGQFIAFASRASNLVPGDTNDAIDVFVRDVSAGVTRLASVDAAGDAAADPLPTSNIPLAGNPMISADGRWVFFESRATNLVAGGVPLGSVNIYARDTWSNVTVLVSAVTTGLAGADGKSSLGSITPDGRFVAFSSTATNMIAGLTNTGNSIYLRDLQAGQVVWATTNCIGCDSPAIDASGRVIAYFGRATDGLGHVVETDTASVYRDDRLTGEHLHLGGATNLFKPVQMSADGNVIAYDQLASGTPAGSIVYVWTPATGTNGVGGTTAAGLSSDGNFLVVLSGGQLNRINLTNNNISESVPLNTNGLPSAGSFEFSFVSVSPDGLQVAFDSVANDLAAQDLNGMSDIFLRDVNAATTELITKAQPSKPAATAFAHSFLGPNSVSADGRFIVSTRYDDPSAYRDTNGWADVFVSDAVSGESHSLSVDNNLYFFDGGGGPGYYDYLPNTNAYFSPMVSADGSTVAAVRRAGGSLSRFDVVWTRASNNVFGSGMFAANRSGSAGGPLFGNGSSYAPSLSTDGRSIVFTTTSSDFVFENGTDNNSTPDVVLRRTTLGTNGLVTGTNYLVSVSMGGMAGNNTSSNGFLSPDGRWVIFESTASDLVTNGTAGLLSLFARDVWSNQTHLVSVAPNGNAQWGYVPGSATISGNSRYVAFSSGNIYLTRHDLQTHTSVIVEDPAARTPALDQSGRYVAFLKQPAGFNFNQVFARDMQGAQSELASVGPGGVAANSACANVVLAGDGRYVIFQTKADNLVNNDTNGANDVFVRDRLLGVTMLVSANGQGRSGNGPSTRPVLAADGRTVVFQSFANDLAAGDYNDRRDLFVLKLGGADADGDGMDDDWEVAYFGNTSRPGSGDFDGDGASDLQEFLAGTDPTNAGSVFRVLTVSPAGGGGKLLFWTGNPARSYRAEFKDDLSTPGWTALTGTISWSGSTANIIDSTATNSTHRYYRAIRLP